ncbi:MAG TPA: DUF5777 family beta-barrel protein [Leptospiraceae bacterium]|nr:DUF5777 family beta-barrel protein [Leptospiraceae bacterium]HMW04459.1 DUF5777 family beta-barrel protein [Leptospiraceae bacterium]HMX31117.1 DUF5777 family beta-barrel protein [Leptospiraceae bacterium]HMY30645.1 DUF5777 family beta-barrel protein [Leptospiraceae bacterium]HMZ65822.1 DUF5777 family beta-barrel protein [Leptospiraceae bacterium]
MKSIQTIFYISLCLFFTQEILAQAQTKSTFMGSSLINMPTTEDVGKDNLDFRFNHRFGNASQTLRTFGGLDQGANTQLSLDYGLSDKWSIGIARTSAYQTYEARTKYKILNQNDSMPISLSFFGVAGQETAKETIKYDTYINPPSVANYINLPSQVSSQIDTYIKQEANEYELSDADKRSYLASILISKRFTDRFSLQISPMYVHRNFVKSQLGNDRTGLDIGGRIKLTKRIDLTFEAIFTPKRDYQGNNYYTEDRYTKYPGLNTLTGFEINQQYNNPQGLAYAALRNIYLDKSVKYYYIPISLGVDIETGGHVFQFFVTNSRTIAHTQLLRGADYDYKKGEWALGFNIHRYFSFAADVE